MKKTLLMAGAAVMFAGVASAAEGLELGIDGYASVYGVYTDQDSVSGTADFNDFGIKKEMELDVNGEVELANGLTVGASLQLQQNATTASDDVQESYIYMEGGFGKVIVGQEYNAAYLMQVSAPSVDAQIDGMDPIYTPVIDAAGVAVDTSYDMGMQAVGTVSPTADRLTYISPVYSGLQLGATYVPDMTDTSVRTATTATTNQEAIALAARYAVNLMDIDWTWGAGYVSLDNATATDSLTKYNLGVNAEIDALTLGVNYVEQNADTATAGDVTSISLGANYENGNFNYGVSYLYTDFDDVTTDHLNRYMAGVNYTYGPGMTLNGSVSYNEVNALADANDNDATVIAVGTVINF